MPKQLLKSGTNIGTNAAKSGGAISNKEFLNKTCAALKECADSVHWVELLLEIGYLTEKDIGSIRGDCEEMIVTMLSTAKTINSKLRISHSTLTAN